MTSLKSRQKMPMSAFFLKRMKKYACTDFLRIRLYRHFVQHLLRQKRCNTCVSRAFHLIFRATAVAKKKRQKAQGPHFRKKMDALCLL